MEKAHTRRRDGKQKERAARGRGPLSRIRQDTTVGAGRTTQENGNRQENTKILPKHGRNEHNRDHHCIRTNKTHTSKGSHTRAGMRHELRIMGGTERLEPSMHGRSKHHAILVRNRKRGGNKGVADSIRGRQYIRPNGNRRNEGSTRSSTRLHTIHGTKGKRNKKRGSNSAMEPGGRAATSARHRNHNTIMANKSRGKRRRYKAKRRSRKGRGDKRCDREMGDKSERRSELQMDQRGRGSQAPRKHAISHRNK